MKNKAVIIRIGVIKHKFNDMEDEDIQRNFRQTFAVFS